MVNKNNSTYKLNHVESTTKEERIIAKKPPLGVTSRHIWELQRIEALTEAINRFKQEDFPYPKEWDLELLEHKEKLKSEGNIYCD